MKPHRIGILFGLFVAMIYAFGSMLQSAWAGRPRKERKKRMRGRQRE